MILIAPLLALPPLPRRAGAPLEQHPGIDTEMGTLEGAGGGRLRTFVTAPAGKAKLAGNFVVGWLSCDSVEETGPEKLRGADRLLLEVVRKSGALVMRMEKPGIGDSEGNCKQLDFDTELEDYRRALSAFLQHPRLDQKRLALLKPSIRPKRPPRSSPSSRGNELPVTPSPFRGQVERGTK